MNLHLVKDKGDFEYLKSTNTVYCNYIHLYDKDWDEFPCLVATDSFDDSNGPYVFTYEFFSLNDYGLQVKDMEDLHEWEPIPSLEDRGEECPNYYYDRDGNLIKRK